MTGNEIENILIIIFSLVFGLASVAIMHLPNYKVSNTQYSKPRPDSYSLHHGHTNYSTLERSNVPKKQSVPKETDMNNIEISNGVKNIDSSMVNITANMLAISELSDVETSHDIMETDTIKIGGHVHNTDCTYSDSIANIDSNQY